MRRKLQINKKNLTSYLIISLLIYVFSCAPEKCCHDAEEQGLMVQTFYTENIGWGYSIFQEGKEIIRQPHIPSVKGIIGFENECEACHTGKLVIDKVKKGSSSPALDIEEVQRIRDLY